MRGKTFTQKPKLGNCPECGKLYLDSGLGMCIDCAKKREDDMSRITRYVHEHPNSGTAAICRDLGVKESLVRYMVRKGYLPNDSAESRYPCAKCGKLIRYGRYCYGCGQEMKKKMERKQLQLQTKLINESGIFERNDAVTKKPV